MLKGFLFIAMAIFTAVSAARPQDAPSEPPKPRLFEELSITVTCEHTLSTIDSFMAELSNDPGVLGEVIIYQPGVDRATVLKTERRIRYWLSRRGFDPARIIIQQGTPQSDAKVQYWIVPLGADRPAIAPEDPNAPKEKPKAAEVEDYEGAPPHNAGKPYIYIEYMDAGGIEGCEDDNVYWEELLSKRLKKHPGSRANIVIKVPTRAEFREKEKERIERMLSYGVPRSQFRLFHQKSDGPMIELWVLPGVKK